MRVWSVTIAYNSIISCNDCICWAKRLVLVFTLPTETSLRSVEDRRMEVPICANAAEGVTSSGSSDLSELSCAFHRIGQVCLVEGCKVKARREGRNESDAIDRRSKFRRIGCPSAGRMKSVSVAMLS